MMIGYNVTVTVYNKSLTDDAVAWEPTTVSGVYTEDVRAINASSTTTASAPATLMDFPADVWAECTVHQGDYIVVGGCDIGAFTGNAAALIDVGGRRVENVSKYLFGTSLDHVEVTVR